MSLPLKWTLPVCKREAKKYKTRTEFFKGAPVCYSKCAENKWLNQVCLHMKDARKKKSWTLQSCREVAKKYTTLNLFRTLRPHCYNVALRNNWIPLITSHMSAPTRDQREVRVTQPLIEELLLKTSLRVDKEVFISKRSRVDFVCTTVTGQKILIEVKSDKKPHSKASIKRQIDKYQFDGVRRFGSNYLETILVSESGRYGLSIKELKIKLKYLSKRPISYYQGRLK